MEYMYVVYDISWAEDGDDIEFEGVFAEESEAQEYLMTLTKEILYQWFLRDVQRCTAADIDLIINRYVNYKLSWASYAYRISKVPFFGGMKND